MKKSLTKTGFFGWWLLSIALDVSFEKSRETQDFESAEVMSRTELKINDEGELISDEITSIEQDIYADDDIRLTSKSTYFFNHLPECATVTTLITDIAKEKPLISEKGANCEMGIC